MDIFIELGFILLVTTLVSLFIRLIKQPLVIGYIISGVIVGPYVFNILKSGEQIELFSKIGISVLLFIVGLSLNPSTIKETGKASLVTGIGQIVFTSVIGFFIMIGLGFDQITSLYGATALTFSSTIIILKLLSDRGDLGKLYGKLSIGFLLVQDLVATLLLIAIPIIGASANANAGSVFWSLALKGVGISILLYAFSKYILSKLFDYLARSQELLFLFSVTWGLVMAGLFYKIGFSIEIGALVAGIALSASTYSFEISSRMRPLRDFFIVMFFVLLGSHVVLSSINSIIWPAIILSVFVLVGNPLIVFVLMNLMGYKKRTAFMSGLTVAQISEFSLILMSLGVSMGHVNQQASSLITLVGIITIAGSTYLVIYADYIFDILKNKLSFLEIRKNKKENNISDANKYEMIIFGYGRVGYEFVKTAQKIKASYLVVDYNPETISNMRGDGVEFRFGDAEDVEFLEEIKMTEAIKIISTIPDPNINQLLVRYYRQKNSTGVIIVTSHNVHEAKALYNEGATYVIMPHYLGAYHAGEMILNHMTNAEAFEQARNIQLAQIVASQKI